MLIDLAKNVTAYSLRCKSIALLGLGILALSACQTSRPSASHGVAPSKAKPQNTTPSSQKANQLNLKPQSTSVSRLGLTEDNAKKALDAFRLSCPFLSSHTDKSGLTLGRDWVAACQAAKNPSSSATAFFDRYFEPVSVGGGDAFVTGYYEPEIAASTQPKAGYAPVYRVPSDLIESNLEDFYPDMKGRHLRGCIKKGHLVPYYSRAEINKGALENRHLEIAWAVDPVALFFLQIQGSGRLNLEDGRVIRIGYANQNGQEYTAIGRLLVQKGVIEKGHTTMAGIVEWLHNHPDQAPSVMESNKSYVFFQELNESGPLGALGVPVTPQISLAVDPAYTPLGAPVFLMLDSKHGGNAAFANGLWIAQDKGGAIKGANRFDSYWGYGNKAEHIAGGLASHGSAWLLLPKGVAARIGSEKHDKAQKGTKISVSDGQDRKSK
ncbi:membrane-bound lytic murein transglycosylase A [Zymomonas mobilis]|uniref:peptidoglycan lytic exotransglycosylase n=1 Tax=Zymomonas mobilis TaxID=542 RepID=A0A542W359_ZYMMB|nr:murein transglycosylase A [Zymomonas mobilis]TQL17939.1 membrane-bound lytic murein transglycosylase A [Zymomonas mobilis]